MAVLLTISWCRFCKFYSYLYYISRAIRYKTCEKGGRGEEEGRARQTIKLWKLIRQAWLQLFPSLSFLIMLRNNACCANKRIARNYPAGITTIIFESDRDPKFEVAKELIPADVILISEVSRRENRGIAQWSVRIAISKRSLRSANDVTKWLRWKFNCIRHEKWKS